MAGKKRAGKKSLGEPPAKRPARGARKNDDPIWSTTNPKSSLVNEDLHGKFADPKAYENWTKGDWEEARANCLPEDAPVAEDGYSVPMQYFKYDLNWRRFVREFQEDLGAGRYDPQWLKEATQAMEERSQGRFDRWKANEYEEFWGQKQRTPWRDLAGESANIKLEELAKHNFVRQGDIFSYARVFGRGKDRILIEKDIRIAKIEGSLMTVAVPPGQLKYARHLLAPHRTPTKVLQKPSLPTEKQVSLDETDTTNHTPLKDLPSHSIQAKREHEQSTHSNAREHSTGNGEAYPSPEKEASYPDAFHDAPEPTSPPPSATEPQIQLDTMRRTEIEKATAAGNDLQEPASPPSPFQSPVEDAILTPISTLAELEKRIIEIDGRVDKSTRIVNSWKAMRGKRNNQDLGSLFEMREEFYVRQSPKIVKTPQTTRSGRDSKKKVRYGE
ncbi:uncharacterized protein KY384_003624 [Bacidia gigantensis]|uniref:uncharacterized protein n=1 Tax=Bacidia gigantensis TaxID=2732470 RepID=UPI001D03A558|nr:uncharacterized protein KY384_003624 [Bacidia gigantensis]KAG8531988.1 hypothetical protein KY384_003624 [Bacidia gigantensis]